MRAPDFPRGGCGAVVGGPSLRRLLLGPELRQDLLEIGREATLNTCPPPLEVPVVPLLAIAVVVALMALIKDNFKAFVVSKLILFTGFVIAGAATLYFRSNPTQVFLWMTGVGLGLYMSYIPFNSNLFDRFIASFRFSGNVGFLIYIADSFGYLGSIAVLLSKTVFRIQLDWTQFFILLTLVVSVAGIIGTLISIAYFVSKHKSVQRASTPVNHSTHS